MVAGWLLLSGPAGSRCAPPGSRRAPAGAARGTTGHPSPVSLASRGGELDRGKIAHHGR
jgi:hypothetical protein